MRDLVLTLFILGMMPLAFYNPRVGLLLWAWVGYMNPHRLTWGFAYNYRFVYFIAIITLAGMLFSPKARVRVPWTSVTIVLMLFIAWTSITTQFAINPVAHWEWNRFMKIQIMTMAILLLIYERRWLHYLVWVLVVSIGFWGMKGGIFTILTGGSFRVYGPQGSFFYDNNAMALALIVVVPLMRYLQLYTRSKALRLLLWVMIITSMAAIVGTYSRGGAVGASVLLLFFWWKSRSRWFTMFFVVIVMIPLLAFMPPKWKDRMGSIVGFTQGEQKITADASAAGRINAWWFAFNLAKDRPFVGGGFQVFQPSNFLRYAPNPHQYHDAHSIYFEVLGEQGFVGLVLFLLIFLFSFRLGNKAIKIGTRLEGAMWGRDLSAMIQVGLVGYAASGAFLGLAYFDLPYTLVAMLVTNYLYLKNQEEQQLANPEQYRYQAQRRTRLIQEKAGPGGILGRPAAQPVATSTATILGSGFDMVLKKGQYQKPKGSIFTQNNNALSRTK
ncbi:MAG: putative O-glycosylation ligase, exosortase A system-associated [Magnetococcales bacterium]|nr:putative O-glycosylation ligase, exosortase A system-associated [Magnetococcales bacterium]